jgi:hypothetical protein
VKENVYKRLSQDIMFISDEGTILYHSAPHKLFMVLKTLNLRSFIFPIFSNSPQELGKTLIIRSVQKLFSSYNISTGWINSTLISTPFVIDPSSGLYGKPF